MNLSNPQYTAAMVVKRIKELQPIKIVTDDFDDLEVMISKLFKDELYLPIIRVLGGTSRTFKNAMEDVVDAINKRRISYHRGKFTGKLNSSISRELKSLGAKWSKGHWTIAENKLPMEIKTAISTSLARFEQTLAGIDDRLSKILPEEIADKLKAEKIFETSLWRTDNSVASSLDGITVSPKLSKEVRAKIAEEYTHDIRRSIKDWAEEEVVKLRKEIQAHTFAGKRYEDVVESIEKRYQVSRTKAKFLARQETNLLMTKFKEARYTNAGVNEYRWGTVVGSPKHPVRPMHKRLDKKIFSWDNPPITSDDGSRNNPGQDYNCRCFARPIVRF